MQGVLGGGENPFSPHDFFYFFYFLLSKFESGITRERFGIRRRHARKLLFSSLDFSKSSPIPSSAPLIISFSQRCSVFGMKWDCVLTVLKFSFFEKRVGGNEFTPTTIYPIFTKFSNYFFNIFFDWIRLRWKERMLLRSHIFEFSTVGTTRHPLRFSYLMK